MFGLLWPNKSERTSAKVSKSQGTNSKITHRTQQKRPETPENTQDDAKKSSTQHARNAEESAPDPAERRQITLCCLVVEGCLIGFPFISH